MTRTGVFATADEIEAMRSNLATLLIALHIPRESPQQQAHRYALGHGLPEIEGYYGCDLRTGEFVSWPP